MENTTTTLQELMKTQEYLADCFREQITLAEENSNDGNHDLAFYYLAIARHTLSHLDTCITQMQLLSEFDQYRAARRN